MRVDALRFAWRDGEVSGVRSRPGGPPRATLVLAHGAGRDMNGAVLAGLAAGLAGEGIEVIRFNFPYREEGRKAPDPQERLEACTWAVAKEVAGSSGRLFLGGASLGGRIATHVVADGFPAAGLVLQSYPLHPPGKPERLRDEHLRRIAVPMLFLSGTRDAFATGELLERTVARLARARIHRVEGADHGMRVRGRAAGDVVAELVRAVADWIA